MADRRLLPIAVFIALTISLSSVVGCELPIPEESVAANTSRIVLSDPRRIPDFVGVWIIIEGKVSLRKIPQIMGVDIDPYFQGQDMRGRYAQASGILQTWTVTQQQIDDNWARSGPYPHRGPGRFYRLVQPGLAGKLAVAEPLEEVSN